jgi:uncharacterized peroxidase-related enzyme
MSALIDVPWEACVLEPQPDRVLERRVRRESGVVGTTVSYFGKPEWAARRLARLSRDLRGSIRLPRALGNLVGLAVSQENSCRYCYASQRMLMRGAGYREGEIRALEQALLTGEFDARERAALDFARRMSRSDPLPGAADLEALRQAGFDAFEIRELAAHVALFVFFNRISTLVALPPQEIEGMPDRWFVKLLAPLLAPWIRRALQAGEPTAEIDDAQRDGPFADLVRSLDGLPVAVTLHETLGEIFGSTIVPARSFGLVFAVVARALGCEKSEAEARRFLAAEGVAGEEVEHVLAHLSGPGLSDLERIVVPYARDTIWYGQVPPVQRRTRELAESLSREELVEVVFAVSVANMVCRLGVITGEL